MSTAQQQRYEVWASNMLCLTFVFNVAADFLLGCGYFVPHKSTEQYFTLYGATPLLLFVYYKIRQGDRGPKMLFLTLYACLLFRLLNGCLPDKPLEATNLLVQHGLQVGASLLLLLSLRTPTESALKTTKASQ